MLSVRPFLLFLAVISVFLLVSNASAKAPDRTGKMEKPSGLQPVFPDNARCIEIASPYGSQTRYDGGRRPGFRFKGYHGGIDLHWPGPDSYLVDPLVIYLEANSSLGKSVDVKSPEKTVTIPCVTTDGHIRPSGTRVVWPVACQPR